MTNGSCPLARISRHASRSRTKLRLASPTLDIAKQVAAENASKLDIVDGRVSTWTVDAFVRLVQQRQGEESFAIRKREIKRMQERGWLSS